MRKFIVVVLLVLIVVPVSCYLILQHGNIQWHKWIYMYQVHHLGNGMTTPPDDYTGIWRDWGSDGDLEVEASFQNGLPSGYHLLWWRNGRIRARGEFLIVDNSSNRYTSLRPGRKETSVRTGIKEQWSADGELLGRGIYKDDRPWHGVFYSQDLENQYYFDPHYYWKGILIYREAHRRTARIEDLICTDQDETQE